MSVLAAGVYRSGILADPRPGAHLDYVTAPGPVVEQVNRIRSVCDRYGVPLWPRRHCSSSLRIRP